MKIAAIVCEFDPLHTGHKRLIDFAKGIVDRVVCVMSGNFTQRGMPACADKYSRARHALLAGADFVVELPTPFAVASAENFAFGGVNVAKKLNADFIVFGSECGSVEKLYECLEVIDRPATQAEIKRQMSAGVSYPKAVAMAAQTDILDKPNNTLAVEYLRAIRRLGANITPVTICREDNFNGDVGEFASSSALRENPALREKYCFDFVTKDINDNIVERYKALVPSFLAVADKEKLAQTEGVTEGLENRILNAHSADFESFMTEIKTKRYTRLKLQRIILNYVLGITKQTVADYKADAPVCALATKKECAALLAQTQKTDELTRRADRLYRSLTTTQIESSLVVMD